MANGYMGKNIRVNLTEGKVAVEDLDLAAARCFLGGSGLAAKVIMDEMSPSVEPLGSENKLLFFTGPLTGTRYPTTGRYEIASKSPLTGIWLDASSAGDWAAFFKKTGHDGIIIEGKSPKPVYLFVDDDKIELRDASHLWGKGFYETQETILKEIGGEKGTRVVGIGPAGEKQVLISAIMNDEGRAAGRGGGGAIMGSKNLKAIAVRGTKTVPLADADTYNGLAKAKHKEFSTWEMSAYGTSGWLEGSWNLGDIPVKNWRVGLWEEGCKSISGKKMAETILKPHRACYMCPLGCSRWVKIEKGRFALEGPGPEYETLGMFGTLLMNDDLESVCYLNELCNDLGLDTISTGSLIGFAMEAYEKGVITKEDAGVDLTWGNVDAIVEMTLQIGQCRGLGQVLGQGARRASAELGQGSEQYAVHVKGLEIPDHDPRAFWSMAVHYATAPRGGCHLHGTPLQYQFGGSSPGFGIKGTDQRFETKGMGLLAAQAQNKATVVNSLIICEFASSGVDAPEMADLLKSATGMDFSTEEMPVIGERIITLQRAFNVRCGVTAKDDVLPPRLLESPTEGGAASKVPNIEEQLREYYEVRGWTEDGIPSREKLEELGLDEAVEQLWG